MSVCCISGYFTSLTSSASSEPLADGAQRYLLHLRVWRRGERIEYRIGDIVGLQYNITQLNFRLVRYDFGRHPAGTDILENQEINIIQIIGFPKIASDRDIVRSPSS